MREKRSVEFRINTRFRLPTMLCAGYSVQLNTQQGRQREPSVKTLCSPLSTEFFKALLDE